MKKVIITSKMRIERYNGSKLIRVAMLESNPGIEPNSINVDCEKICFIYQGVPFRFETSQAVCKAIRNQNLYVSNSPQVNNKLIEIEFDFHQMPMFWPEEHEMTDVDHLIYKTIQDLGKRGSKAQNHSIMRFAFAQFSYMRRALVDEVFDAISKAVQMSMINVDEFANAFKKMVRIPEDLLDLLNNYTEGDLIHAKPVDPEKNSVIGYISKLVIDFEENRAFMTIENECDIYEINSSNYKSYTFDTKYQFSTK